MIYPSDLKEHSCETMQDYFQLIVDTHNADEYDTAEGLYNLLSKSQKLDFKDWEDSEYGTSIFDTAYYLTTSFL